MIYITFDLKNQLISYFSNKIQQTNEEKYFEELLINNDSLTIYTFIDMLAYFKRFFNAPEENTFFNILFNILHQKQFL